MATQPASEPGIFNKFVSKAEAVFDNFKGEKNSAKDNLRKSIGLDTPVGDLAPVQEKVYFGNQWVHPEPFKFLIDEHIFLSVLRDPTQQAFVYDALRKPLIKLQRSSVELKDRVKFLSPEGTLLAEIKESTGGGFFHMAGLWEITDGAGTVIASIQDRVVDILLPQRITVYNGTSRDDKIYQCKGNERHNFTVNNTAGTVAAALHLKQHQSRLKDGTFELQVAPGADSLLMLIIAITLFTTHKDVTGVKPI